MDMVDVSRQLTDQQTLTAFVAGVLAFVALYLALAPVNECSSCVHCATERRQRANDPYCPLHRVKRSRCGDQHDPENG